MSDLRSNVIDFIRQTFNNLQSGASLLIIEDQMDSCIFAILDSEERSRWISDVLISFEFIKQKLRACNNVARSSLGVGRPRLEIPIDYCELLLSIGFKVTEIAKLFSVCRLTISNRLAENGINVRSLYSQLNDAELDEEISKILERFPSTGYKRMKGFLLAKGIKIAETRIRESMRHVDPIGVYQRTCSNRAIVRRQYNIRHFNHLWHMDTNLKLRRWNMVVRGCIDGGTKVGLYLEIGNENSAASHFNVFQRAVDKYGIPKMTRSDKGGENIQIAEFMINNRGIGSHICGRSVHNQRIERHWRDVYYGYLGTMANLFLQLEEDGHLCVDKMKHLFVLHYVFLDRMNDDLETFRISWNHHPISTESNKTPNQLMILFPFFNSEDPHILSTTEFSANVLEEFNTDDTIMQFGPVLNTLTDREISQLSQIDVRRHSEYRGYDVFVDAINCLEE